LWLGATFFILTPEERKMIAEHGVRTPLHQLCEMVRAGEIPGHEVRQLIVKYEDAPDQSKTLETMLDDLRIDAPQFGDESDRACAWALIAIISRDENDIRRAHDTIVHGIESSEEKAKSLAAVARTFAEGGRFKEARALAEEIGEFSGLWQAEAFLQVARFSRDERDFEQAHTAIMERVVSAHLQDELLEEIAEIRREIASGKPHHGANQKQQKEAMDEVFSALGNLYGFEHIHGATSHVSSASKRFELRAALAKGLARTMR